MVKLGTRDGRGMCVYLVSKTMNHVHGGVLIPSKSTEMNLITFLAKRFSPFVVFIIFYKYGLWVFLGCQACFMCLGGVLY